MILAAIPIAAPAVIVVVAAIEEEESSSPEPAAPAEIAIPVSEAGEAAATAGGEVTAACGEIAPAGGEAAVAYTTRTATSMRAADKDERGTAVGCGCSKERTRRYGQAKSCRCCDYHLLYIHDAPF